MPTFDLVVKGGELVDGTGAARRRADIGVRDGRIVAVGDVDGTATKTIDADGLVVAPGIVDIHTHFDAQVLWDPACTPSPLHGVTTVFSGNCGFTIAPVEESEIDYLVRMLSHVEGIPLDSLYAGVDFAWKSFGEYLDRLDGNVGVNIGLLTGHSALRRVVMGADAVGNEASEAQIDAMTRLLHESLTSGAMGFSSSQSVTHNDGEGDPVPSRWASRGELVALAGALRDHAGTTIEFIPGIVPFTDEMLDRMADMSLAADRPVNWNVLTGNSDAEPQVRATLKAHERIWARGAKVVPLTFPAVSTVHLNLRGGFGYDALPGWAKIFRLPVPERTQQLADPAVRRRLAEGSRSEEAGLMRQSIAAWERQTVLETFAPENKVYEGRVVGDIAAELGQDAFDVMLDIAVRDDLRTIFKAPQRGNDDASWKLKRELWRSGKTVIGASDAGAHVDTIVTFNYATNMLAACRDRNLVPLEEAIHLITEVPARFYGLKDRGRVEEGCFADLMIFDADTVGSGPVHWRDDLPAGAGRLYAEAEGIAHVVVNGTEIVTGKELTGAVPGTVLRSGRDTETVTASS